MRLVLPSLLAPLIFLAPPVRAGNSASVASLDARATAECAGLRLFLEGDDDHDATATVAYRPSGGAWQPAQPLLRLDANATGNLLAGSVFRLEEATDYEFRVTFSDPDGGSDVRTVEARTRAAPRDPVQPRTRYVVPGSGGGSGTASDPFRGFAAANAAAVPGDVFIVRAGTYTGTAILDHSGTEENPIVWRGEDPSAVILDGQLSVYPLLDLPAVRHVHVEGMTLQNPRRYAVRATATEGLVLRGCTIRVPDVAGQEMGGICLLGAGHSDAWISDNRVFGPIVWEDGRGDDDSYAIRLQGRGHVLRNNEIRDWWDGTNVGVDDPSVETSDCDVSHNEIHNCIDDGIETDGSFHNIRVFENRITNVLCGLSAQPVYGGPVYMVRNVVYDWQLKPLKFHLDPSGLIVVNNTFVGADPRGWGGGEWCNTLVENNLFLGGSQGGQTGQPICLDTAGDRARMNNNGWRQVDPQRFAYWNGSFYPTLQEFRDATGLETSARLVDLDVFVDAEEPPLGSYMGQDGFIPPYDPGSQDLRLTQGCAAVDAGIYFANLGGTYTGSAPDLGAYETGQQVPLYGPRPEAPAVVAASVARSRPFLHPALPNPFHAETVIRFDLPAEDRVHLAIVDAVGRRVRVLLDEACGAGTRTVAWDGRDEQGRAVAPGFYFARVDADRAGIVTRKILKIR
ncbi:MAG: right-handed parallel beta-helix repeat-containing protein [Candidatus Eisenbacteria bacterium]